MLLPFTGRSYIYCCSNIIFHIYWSIYYRWFATTRYIFSPRFLARRWPFNRLRNEPNHSRNHTTFACRFVFHLSSPLPRFRVSSRNCSIFSSSRDRLPNSFVSLLGWRAVSLRKKRRGRPGMRTLDLLHDLRRKNGRLRPLHHRRPTINIK